MKFLVLFPAFLAAASASTLVKHPGGAVTPAETPEVAAAKAQHFAAKHGHAYGLPHAAFPHAYGYPAAGLAYGHNAYAAPAYTYNSLPLAYNNLAYNNLAYNNLAYNLPYAPIAAPHAYAPSVYNYAPTLLESHSNGAVTPVETPEVMKAKAEHFAAHGLNTAVYAAGYPAVHGLVSHSNGAIVPVDEPAVQKAREEHLAAHAAH